MSMWEYEAFFETTARLVHQAALPAAEKRALYAALWADVNEYDVKFVHFRLLDEFVTDGFLHRIDAAAYPAGPSGVPTWPARETWLTDGDGQTEGLWIPEPRGDHPPGIWFDVGMALWPRAVAAGLVDGVTDPEIAERSLAETLAVVLRIAVERGNGDAAKLVHGYAAFSLTDAEPGDPLLASVLELPGLPELLRAPAQAAWIEERFDARLAVEHGLGDADFLAWWCAPLEG